MMTLKKCDFNKIERLIGGLRHIYLSKFFKCLDPLTNRLDDQATSCNASISRAATDGDSKSKGENMQQRLTSSMVISCFSLD